MLKITAPFREKNEVLPLIEAGADELYCGYLSAEWTGRYTGLEFERKGRGSNFTDLKELSDAVDLAHQRDIPVYLALNGLYVREQYPLLLKILSELDKIDFDAYIVADLGLLLTLRARRRRKEIHISTGGTVFNSEAVEFYRSLGASRIVLDRQVTLSSMKELAERHINIDFEVFILHTLCVYIDGFCTFMHTYGRESMEEVSGKNPESAGKTVIMTAHDPLATADACSLKYSVTPYDAFTNEKISYADLTPTFFKQLRDGVECGACALYDISRTMTKAVKIVGRQLHPKIRIASVGFIRKCLDMLKDGESIGREDYIKRVQGLYRKTFAYENECRGNNCYHPEVINKFERKRPYNFQVTKIQEQSYGR